jgi:hypothetical protein
VCVCTFVQMEYIYMDGWVKKNVTDSVYVGGILLF